MENRAELITYFAPRAKGDTIILRRNEINHAMNRIRSAQEKMFSATHAKQGCKRSIFDYCRFK
jgi:hypothetical protein